MTQIRRYEYSNDKQITAQISDSIDNFLWVAFAQNSDGNCVLEKQAKFHVTQTYFSLNRAVTKINALDIDSSKLYVSYEDSTLLGEIISKTNPLTSTTEISRGAIVESPIDVKISGTDLWYLLPGEASGTNTQLLRYDTDGVLIQTVDLTKSGETVTNAKSMAIDSNDDIWIVTHTDPTNLIRVFEISGGLFDFEITENL